MSYQILYYVLPFYGLFLIGCGITAVAFIGLKAKTALISGGTSGAIFLWIPYLMSCGVQNTQLAGLVISFGLFIVFCWRSTKTLFAVFPMIASAHPDLKGKGIAFLIISLMAVVSFVVFGFQMVLYLAG